MNQVLLIPIMVNLGIKKLSRLIKNPDLRNQDVCQR
jgi:hypothetical protein